MIEAMENGGQFLVDTKGAFRVSVDRQEEAIVAVHYASLDMEKPNAVIKGKSAEAVYRQIVERELFGKVDHAAYVGAELAKAEIALKTGKGYMQDAALIEQQYLAKLTVVIKKIKRDGYVSLKRDFLSTLIKGAPITTANRISPSRSKGYTKNIPVQIPLKAAGSM